MNANQLAFEAEQILAQLPVKQRRFVEEYNKSANGAESYQRAGFKAKSISSASDGAGKLLKKPDIARALELLRQARSLRTQITADRVLEEYARIAFSDLGNVISVHDGRPTIRSFEEMGEDTRRSVQSIEIRTAGEYADIVKIKMFDKLGALGKLAEHLGLTKSNRNDEDSPLLQFLLAQLGKVNATTQPSGPAVTGGPTQTPSSAGGPVAD